MEVANNALFMCKKDKDAILLFQLAKGELMKQYVNDIPEWAFAIYVIY